MRFSNPGLEGVFIYIKGTRDVIETSLDLRLAQFSNSSSRKTSVHCVSPRLAGGVFFTRLCICHA